MLFHCLKRVLLELGVVCNEANLQTILKLDFPQFFIRHFLAFNFFYFDFIQSSLNIIYIHQRLWRIFHEFLEKDLLSSHQSFFNSLFLAFWKILIFHFLFFQFFKKLFEFLHETRFLVSFWMNLCYLNTLSNSRKIHFVLVFCHLFLSIHLIRLDQSFFLFLNQSCSSHNYNFKWQKNR